MAQATHIGVSAAGVEWNVWRRDDETSREYQGRVRIARKAFERHAARAALRGLSARYRSCRAEVMRLKGRALAQGVSSWKLPGYIAASDRLSAARKALRKAERQAAFDVRTFRTNVLKLDTAAATGEH